MAKIDRPIWPVPDSATPEQKALAARRFRRVVRLLIISIFFFASFQIGQVGLTNKVANDFDYNMATLGPLIDPKEAAAFRVAFARMKTREDYLALMARMTDRAKVSGVELPR